MVMTRRFKKKVNSEGTTRGGSQWRTPQVGDQESTSTQPERSSVVSMVSLSVNKASIAVTVDSFNK